jgi:hypothetical protein
VAARAVSKLSAWHEPASGITDAGIDVCLNNCGCVCGWSCGGCGHSLQHEAEGKASGHYECAGDSFVMQLISLPFVDSWRLAGPGNTDVARK